MDTNDIFKIPSSNNKRKLAPPGPPVFDSSNFASTSTTVQDNGNERNGRDEEEEVDRSFAPGQDADYYIEEDDDGRFFGSGLNSVQKQVLNLMESGEAPEVGETTNSSIRKQILALERAINKNRDMRTKFGNDPIKFVDSEYTLLESLQALLLLASSPLLAYPLLLELSTPASLADLLSHENTEVVIAVIEVLEEWTDEEVLDGEIDEDEEDEDESGLRDREDRKQVMRGLVQGLIDSGVVESVVSGLSRFDESDEAERGGVYHTFGLLENMLSLSPPIAATLLSPKSSLLPFLLKRFGQDKAATELDQNRYYAAELLAIILGGEVEGVREGRDRLAQEEGGVDGILKVLSVYRRRDPASADELEFLENVFDALCSALSSPLVKSAFLEGEGPELCVIMMKEQKVSSTRAVKALDHALSGKSGIALCEKFVEVLGLKTLFKNFMGKASSSSTHNNKRTKLSPATHEDTEHLLSVISSLLTSLTSDSPSRIRLLAKFVENDYEKIDRLIEIREDVETRVADGEDDIQVGNDDDEDEEDEKYLRRLEKGLFSLQLADYIIAWLCMEDDGARDHIKMLLARKDRSLSDVMKVLIEYHSNIGDLEEADETKEEEGETKEMTEVEEQRMILDHLLNYLHGLDS